jgi:hypothetical protein
MKIKKCPPGVICVENITLTLMMFILGILLFFIYMNFKPISIHEKNNITIDSNIPYSNLNFIPNIPYTNNDVLTNPYSPPLSDERYLTTNVIPTNVIPTNVIPINVSTNISNISTNYRQMGIITPLNETTVNNILPLMGKPLYSNRNKWNYYTISNQHNNIKLPISFKGKGGLNDNGVDQIYSGDTVYVDGYNDAFRATIYENDTIKYLPFI